MKLTIADIQQSEDMAIYFNWSLNALLPIYPGAADRYFEKYRETIIETGQRFLARINYTPQTIYRGIIMRKPICCLAPHETMKYLSFSTDIKVAEHFADVNGFGSDIVDVKKQLGTYGYIIEHTPAPIEILFHYELLDILPYAEAINLIGINGQKEVNGLKKKKEIMIEQPKIPFTNIKSYENEIATLPTW